MPADLIEAGERIDDGRSVKSIVVWAGNANNTLESKAANLAAIKVKAVANANGSYTAADVTKITNRIAAVQAALASGIAAIEAL